MVRSVRSLTLLAVVAILAASVVALRNVRGDSDVWQGAFIQRQTEDLTWGATVAYFADEIGDSRNIPGVETFNDTDDLNGFDIRGAAAYRLSDSMILGGGMKRGHVHGVTADERPCVVTKDPVHLIDLHATIYSALGISPTTSYDANAIVF